MTYYNLFECDKSSPFALFIPTYDKKNSVFMNYRFINKEYRVIAVFSRHDHQVVII